jgi:hypothetical protein
VATGRDTKANLKDVNMATAVIETEIRKEQHERVSCMMYHRVKNVFELTISDLIYVLFSL